MRIEIEATDETVDKLLERALTIDYRALLNDRLLFTELDRKHHKKLCKAFKRVLDYYGVEVE